MKCVCGYERLERWQTDDGVAVGNKKFINLDFGRYPVMQLDDDYGYASIQPTVYACPKCGTLKIDL